MIETKIDKTKIKELTEKYFKEGFYCSEAVVKAFEDVTGHFFTDDFKKSMTILGEGIGGTGCICGAVSGSILIAGLFTGRKSPDEDKSKAKNIGKKFMKRFKEKYKTTCCKALTKKSELILGIGKYKHCPEISGFCAEILIEILIEEKIIN